MRKKHRKDHKNPKRGFIGGNPRYGRKIQNHYWDFNPTYNNDKIRYKKELE